MSSSCVEYSLNWLKLQYRGDDLVRFQEQMPKIVSTIRVQTHVTLQEEEKDSIIGEVDLRGLREVPDKWTLEQTIQAMSGEDERILVHMTGIGILDRNAVQMLKQVSFLVAGSMSLRTIRSVVGLIPNSTPIPHEQIRDTVEFTTTLSRAMQWLDQTVRHADSKFATWILNYLNTPAKDPFARSVSVLFRVFSPNFYMGEVSLTSFLSLCLDECLNVEALEVIMGFFRYCYSSGGRNLFLDPDVTKDGGPLSDEDVPEMLYAFVPTMGHWGVVCLDLLRYKIYFGDSHGRKAPVREVYTIIERLMPSNKDRLRWDEAMKKVESLEVPKQVPGSCSILTAVAIEKAVNPYPKWDQHVSVEYHRIRYLSLLTRHIQVV
ncbi:hypothetical protein BGX34_003500 [Mortierella sp. NVP85]|nr:hypothetical protein BGX34_003500 [Mortierella sp. NVP85]